MDELLEMKRLLEKKYIYDLSLDNYYKDVDKSLYVRTAIYNLEVDNKETIKKLLKK